MTTPPPLKLDLKKDRGLAVRWADGAVSYYSIAYLRRMSPSADARQQREELEKNPLAVIQPSRGSGGSGGPLVAESAALVGGYAIRIEFSDGHRTGIYSWEYLREIDPREEPPPGFEVDEEPESEES
ncbi:MAG: DUF971 domain-containing protein [Planctomycetota bacterium]